MTDLDIIKSKKSTGEDLGRLILKLHGIQKLIENDQYHSIANADFTITDLLMSVAKLNAEQSSIFFCYERIANWLEERYNKAILYAETLDNTIIELENKLIHVMQIETVCDYVGKLPVIVTQKQYENMITEGISEYLSDKEGFPNVRGMINLIVRCLSYWLMKLKTNPSDDNPLKDIRKDYVNEPVKSKVVLSNYYRALGKGYYTTSSGNRSDKVSDSEWIDIVSQTKIKRALKKNKAQDAFGKAISCDSAESYLKMKEPVMFLGDGETPVWHYYDSDPEGISKWDIIEQELLLDLYPVYNGAIPSYEDFYSEFKSLADVVIDDIDKRYISDGDVRKLLSNYKWYNGRKFSEIPISEWGYIYISVRDLYAMDFYNEKGTAECDYNTFNGDRRALFNGIAVLRPSDITSNGKCNSIDSNGYYKEPDFKTFLSWYSLESFFNESEFHYDDTRPFRELQKNVSKYLSRIQAFNKMLEIVKARYKVNELDAFFVSEEPFKSRINSFNKTIEELKEFVVKKNMIDTELQGKKLNVIEEYIKPIEYKPYRFRSKDVQTADEEISNLMCFLVRQPIESILLGEVR